jgi:HEAT repeat protein
LIKTYFQNDILMTLNPIIITIKDGNMENLNVEELKSNKDVQGLIQILSIGNLSIRQSAVIALGEIGDERAVEPLIELLKKTHQSFNAGIDFDFNIKFLKIIKKALGKIGSPALIPLLNALKDVDAVGALKKIGSPAIEPLIQLLNNENDVLRRRAVQTLGLIKDVRAIEPLIQSLMDDDAGVRICAVGALENIGDNSATLSLCQCLKDNDVNVRHSAAAALGEIGDPRAVDSLIQNLESEAKWTVRQNIVRALGEIGDPRATESISNSLNDSDEFVRDMAKRALVEIKSRNAEN